MQLVQSTNRHTGNLCSPYQNETTDNHLPITDTQTDTQAICTVLTKRVLRQLTITSYHRDTNRHTGNLYSPYQKSYGTYMLERGKGITKMQTTCTVLIKRTRGEAQREQLTCRQLVQSLSKELEGRHNVNN